jgi:translation initiation factor 3 subunit B
MVLLNTFQHSGVKNVIFSNNEHFIISYNGTVLNTSSQENYIVWNTVTGKKLRSFKVILI